MFFVRLIIVYFRIKPPMCITKQDVDFAVEVFKLALDKCGMKA